MLSKEKKEFISNKIKNINISDIEQEMKKLIEIGNSSHTIGPRSRVGNNVVDYFTFLQRLETKGKYDVNFFEFIEKIDENLIDLKSILDKLNIFKVDLCESTLTNDILE